MFTYLELGSRRLSLQRPVVMGIVNLTPDSFSDGGRHQGTGAALLAAEEMIAAGAEIIDLGAESTRPGATPVDASTQLERLLPVLEPLRAASDVAISVDTGDPDVMRRVAEAGADMINDIYALRQPGALQALVEIGIGVCLGHMQGTPATMQDNPSYRELPGEVVQFLGERVAAATTAGVAEDRIAVDPGFGFGKSDRHNVQLLSGLDEFAVLGCPLTVGLSRKATLGRLTGREQGARLAAGLAAAVLAVERGARIVRTHDVPETVDALRIVHAVDVLSLE